jgi:hypothetical protein
LDFKPTTELQENMGNAIIAWRAWFSRIARILSVGWLFCAFHVQYMALYGGEGDVRCRSRRKSSSSTTTTTKIVATATAAAAAATATQAAAEAWGCATCQQQQSMT